MLEYQPKKILEIGTWYGASAAAMVDAGWYDGRKVEVWTCDKHDFYQPADEFKDRIYYYNMLSGEMLRKLKDKGPFDMAFVDARLKEGDEERLAALLT